MILKENEFFEFFADLIPEKMIFEAEKSNFQARNSSFSEDQRSHAHFAIRLTTGHVAALWASASSSTDRGRTTMVAANEAGASAGETDGGETNFCKPSDSCSSAQAAENSNS